MAFVVDTLILSSSLQLNKIKSHTKLKNYNDTAVIGRCKFCCKSCHRICPRALAKYKTRLKAQQRDENSDNFIITIARYITQLHRWTNESLFADDFLQSIVASAILFAIGVKLTGELKACNLLRTAGP